MTTQAIKDQNRTAINSAVDAAFALIPVDVVLPPPTPGQVIDSFTVQPAVVAPGGLVVVSWVTRNASAVTLDGVGVSTSGSKTITAQADATHTLVASGAVPDVTARVFVDVQEPLPPMLTGLVPAIGNCMMSNQLNYGPADWIDLSKLPAPIPWRVYTNAATGELAPSNNGVRPKRWKRIHPWGAQSWLYSQIPIIQDGQIIQYSPHMGAGEPLEVVKTLRANPGPVGPRGVGLINPYILWHAHRRAIDPLAMDNPKPAGSLNPRMPLAIGARLDGAMIALMTDGSSYTMGWINDAVCLQDWTFFKPNSPTRQPGELDTTKIFFVVDKLTLTTSRIVRVDRTPAAAAQVKPGPEDWHLWNQTVFANIPGNVTSIRCVPDTGIMYACDNSRGLVLKITPDGTISTLLSVPRAMFIDYTSTGKLAVITSMTELYVIDPTNPVLGPDLLASKHGGAYVFLSVSVDRHGTIGPVDDLYVCRIQGAGNNDYWRISAGVVSAVVGTGNGLLCIGEALYNAELGHYPWVLEVLADQGGFIAQGFSNPVPSLFIGAQPNDPIDDPYDHALFSHGMSVLKAGSTAATPLGTRPSFTAQMSMGTHSLLGITGDYVGEMTYADAAAYVQKGMHGSFPRPEIVGYDLLSILYVLYRSSQRYLVEGAPLIAGLRAWVKAAYPSAPVTPGPDLPNPASARYMVARKAGAGIEIVLLDLYTNGYSLVPDAVIRVVADKGMPFEKSLGELASPWKLASHGLTGQHALTCELVSGGNSSYYNQTRILVT